MALAVSGPPAPMVTKLNTSPISRIPVEILIKIFGITVDTYNDDCIDSVVCQRSRPKRHPILDDVRRVCVEWFNIAGSVTSLWTTIFMEPTLLVDQPRRLLTRQLNHVKRANISTTYSGNTRPLSVIINPHRQHWSKDDPLLATSLPYFYREMTMQINRCIHPQFGTRIGSLSIRFTSIEIFSYFEQTCLSADGAAILSNLHTLSIVIDGSGEDGIFVDIDLESLFAELLGLRHLQIVSHYGDFTMSDAHKLGRRLQTFKLERGEINYQEVITVLTIMQVAQSISLQGLQPTFCAPTARELRRERISRPFLEKLVFKGCHLQATALGFFLLPNLQVLEVENTSLKLLHNRLVPLIEQSGCTLTHLKVFHYQETRDCDSLPDILLDPHIRAISNVSIQYKFYKNPERQAELRRRKVVRDYFAELDVDHMRRVVSPSFRHELRRSLDPRLKDNYILWGDYTSY